MLHLVRSMLPKGEALGSFPSWREVDRTTSYARVYRLGNASEHVVNASGGSVTRSIYGQERTPIPATSGQTHTAPFTPFAAV